MSAKTVFEWNGTRTFGPVAIHLPPRNVRTSAKKFWLNGSRLESRIVRRCSIPYLVSLILKGAVKKKFKKNDSCLLYADAVRHYICGYSGTSVHTMRISLKSRQEDILLAFVLL